MSNLFSKYETDPAKETKGIRIMFDDCVFICKRAGGGNREHAFVVSATALAMKDELDSEDRAVSAAAEREVMLIAFAESAIVGWENVLDRDGNPWPFSKENFLELMRACPDVWNHIRAEARDIENFRKVQASEVAESLGKSSSGTTDGAST